MGVTVSQVNALLQRFDQAAKMMRRMSNKVGAGVPGFGGPTMGGGKGKGKGKKNKKKSGKSGNPMKREAEEKALRDKLAGKSSGSTGGSAFAKKPQNPALPAGLELADEGKSLIFISSEIEEMLRTCNRMAVLRDGQKVGEIDEADMNQMNVMKAIAGGEQ